ncbi:protein SDA1 homolog [Apostichopus japonicus]|uniref:protein SDA1 homolog n=1 Tax=Stichopus japonicus TaxID=307972 RepID=UPI003AB66AFC
MSEKNRNQLPSNLPQLQNLIKRDPESYFEEFQQQHRHYQSHLQVFQLKPTVHSKDVIDLTMFLCQVSLCYPKDLSGLPLQLTDILQRHGTEMNSEMRMVMCRGLMILRNRGLMSPTSLLELFFELFRCQDKNLRLTLYRHIVSDIKKVNSKHKDNKLNTSLQNFMYRMLQDSSAVAAKMSLNVMVELYRKNIWKDAKTVNVIVTACFSKVTKIMVTAINFFLGVDEIDDDSDSDSEGEKVNPKHLLLADRVNKKTKKRKKKLDRAKKLIKKSKKKQKPETFNFSALHLVHDPQGFAEGLFKQLDSRNERFEVKLMTMNLISRLIGVHQLFLFNFYPYLQRFMQPHQTEVTSVLLFGAQATHDLVPPEIIQNLLKTIVNNFVTERNSNEVMAIGLNAVREVCSRCPLAMTGDLLGDLAQYKKYRNKAVVASARSLIQLYRSKNPDLLHKKDRGKPTESTVDIKVRKYGEVDAEDFVKGAEVLPEANDGDVTEKGGEKNDEWETASEESDGSDGGWIDVKHLSDEAEAAEDDPSKDLTLEERETKAAGISQSRLITQNEFQKIRLNQLQKEVLASRPIKGNKRKFKEVVEVDDENSELIALSRIESIQSRPRHDKEARLATVLAGKTPTVRKRDEKRRRNPKASTTNKEKARSKPFMMVKQKKSVRGKHKRSFRDKQIALRDALIKRTKMKR